MNTLPSRPQRQALNVMIRATTKAAVVFHAAGRDISQARATEELIQLGALAVAFTENEAVTMIEFETRVREIVSPRTGHFGG